jgi:hypothetical protein
MITQTKEQRYELKMESLGFTRRKFWVHKNDYPVLKSFADKLRDKRKKT